MLLQNLLEYSMFQSIDYILAEYLQYYVYVIVGYTRNWHDCKFLSDISKTPLISGEGRNFLG
jgi:hypothetical protein